MFCKSPGQTFVGAAGAFVDGDDFATLRLDPEGIPVAPKVKKANQ